MDLGHISKVTKGSVQQFRKEDNAQQSHKNQGNNI